MTWMDQLRFGVAHVLLNGVGTSLPWRGKLNFLTGFYAADNPTLQATDIGFSLAPGAASGDIAVASSGSPTTWTASPPATVLRTGYDSSPAEVAVAHDAGVGWVALATWLRTDLASATQRHVDAQVRMVVTEETGAPTAPMDTGWINFSYTRRDSTADTLTNTDEGSTSSASPPVVYWTLNLPAAAAAAAGNALLNLRLRRGTGGDAGNLYLEAQAHATQDRGVKHWLYIDNEAS
jgi:hypothetical protein